MVLPRIVAASLFTLALPGMVACVEDDPAGRGGRGYPFLPGPVDFDVDLDTIDIGGGGGTIGDGCNEGNLSIAWIGQSGPAGQTLSVPNGGCATDRPFNAEYDSGLTDLVALAPATNQSVDVDVFIDGATVSATHFGTDFTANRNARTNFWLQDGLAQVQVFLTNANQSAVSIRVGQRVRMQVTRLTDFNGTLQVTAVAPIADGTLADVTLIAEERDVFYEPRTGTTLAPSDINRLVHIEGVVVGGGGGCGGTSLCWDVEHGGEMTVLRSSSNQVSVGRRVEYAGPVIGFNGNPQLDSINFSWMRLSN